MRSRDLVEGDYTLSNDLKHRNTIYRICLGRYVANDTLFIYLATILWAFSVQADSPPSPTDYDYGGVVLYVLTLGSRKLYL